ncbi:MAG TPA: efflux RND transporter periplasmic adaptor subunit [Vicinamibacterales bacterium]|nr:efflux RND transporter periplasmic adaptor subunit [Vicinamibacterales bacterium]
MPKVVLILVVLCTAGVVITGCTDSSAEPDGRAKQAAKHVKTEAVRQESVRRTLEVVGTLAAEDQVTVSSEVEGVVRRVLADLGDRVKSGQALVEIDREKLQYNLDQQRAAHARALTKYGASEADQLPRVEDTPDVRRAAAELAQAKQAFDRASELHKRQLIAQQLLDDADTTLRLKRAGYDTALQEAKNLRADIDASAAAMKLADRQLRDTSIRAPFDGYIQQRMVSLGELVKAQMPVMTVVRVDPLKLRSEIPERMAPWVKVGQPLTLSVDAFPDKQFTATVSRISPAVTTQTRTFAFEALAPNPEALLKPGTFARVRLETSLVEQVKTIPYAAMQYRYGVYRAFIVEGDRLEARELKTGDRVGDRMEILDGVNSGDRVALTDVDTLTDGMKISAAGE